ncbi:hypothetical protein Hanom_Chr17g01531911 [Helianthus anomalus]
MPCGLHTNAKEKSITLANLLVFVPKHANKLRHEYATTDHKSFSLYSSSTG